MKTLQDAVRSVGKKPAQALAVMRAHWEATRSPALAKLVVRLGATTGTPLEALPATQVARGRALASAARDSTAADRSAVVAAFEEFARNALPSNVWPVLGAWVAVEPDPRVARMALGLLTKPGAVREVTFKLRKQLRECLMHHADPSLTPELELWAAHAPPSMRPWATRIVAKVKATRVAGVDEGALAALDAVVPREVARSTASGGAADGEALLDAIYAAPDDDAPRLAWADWLTERGDPRGEFIVLQINRARGKPTKEARAREDELLLTHRAAFLATFDAPPAAARASGAVPASIGLSGLRFERGFVAKCALSYAPGTHREFALLEDVDFTGRPVRTNNRFPALRVARRVSAASVPTLVELAPHLEHLELATSSLAGVRAGLAKVKHPLRVLRAELSSQEPPADVLPTLVSARACAQLAHLELSSSCRTWGYEPDTPPVPAVLPARLFVGLPAALTRIVVELNYGTVRLVWKRGPKGTSLECRVGRGNEYTLARIVAGALAGFVHAPLEAMDVAVDPKNKTFKKSILDGYLKPLRAGAKTIRFTSG